MSVRNRTLKENNSEKELMVSRGLAQEASSDLFPEMLRTFSGTPVFASWTLTQLQSHNQEVAEARRYVTPDVEKNCSSWSASELEFYVPWLAVSSWEELNKNGGAASHVMPPRTVPTAELRRILDRSVGDLAPRSAAIAEIEKKLHVHGVSGLQFRE